MNSNHRQPTFQALLRDINNFSLCNSSDGLTFANAFTTIVLTLLWRTFILTHSPHRGILQVYCIFTQIYRNLAIQFNHF